ncbi:MAG: hypothetical protein L6R40_005435 [Gallowayella cf. fulva]|nr:MAG: hypothetical protein L6R40_005435 [Xanthomendoza cf. fulva]
MSVSPPPREREGSAAYIHTNARKDIETVVDSSSPLMRLPAELRIKIWTYVLGDRLVVINSAKVFGNRKCGDYEDDDEISKSRQRAAYRLRRTWGRFCHIADSAASSVEKYRVLKQRIRGYTRELEFFTTAAEDSSLNIPCSAIDPSILCASRQVYEEAFHILWTTNTFSIHRADVLGKLTSSLSVAQRGTLAKLHIALNIDPRDYNSSVCWDRVLGTHLTRKLPTLRQLGVDLNITRRPNHKSPLVDLTELHISPTVKALSASLHAVPRTHLTVRLDRNRDNTLFDWPHRLFDDSTPPYSRLIQAAPFLVPRLSNANAVAGCSNGLLESLEMFYEAYILYHPDVERVKTEYERKEVEYERERGAGPWGNWSMD